MSAAYTSYVDQPGLLGALSAAGLSPRYIGTTLYVSDLAAAQSIVASYNPLAATQAEIITQIQTILSEKIAAGFTYNGVTVGINPSNGDIQNITAMAATAMANIQATALGITVEPWPTNFAWLPQGSGASLPLTPAEMITFGDAASHYYSALILYADNLESQVMAATTAADVLAINITTGWPTS